MPVHRLDAVQKFRTGDAEPGGVDQTLFASALVKVGKFRCGVHDRLFVGNDTTENYCFVFPRSAVWIEHEGEPPFVADANVTPLYNPGRRFRRRPISPDGDRTDWFAVAPDVIRDVVGGTDPKAADSQRLFRFGVARSNPRTYLLQRRVFNHVSRAEPADSLFVEESVVGLLSDVIASAYGALTPASVHPRRREVVEHTRAELNRSLLVAGGLGELARTVQTSVFHLCRIFAQATGWTIHQYRTQVRLRRSLELLDAGDGDILATALEVGFSSHSHFTGAFHRTFGLTPSAYKAARSAHRRARWHLPHLR